jgi:hypothetical protein
MDEQFRGSKRHRLFGEKPSSDGSDEIEIKFHANDRRNVCVYFNPTLGYYEYA